MLKFIAGITDKSWDTLIKEHILDPLKMSSTKTSFKEAYNTGNTLKGYEPFDKKFYQLQVDADM